MPCLPAVIVAGALCHIGMVMNGLIRKVAYVWILTTLLVKGIDDPLHFFVVLTLNILPSVGM